MAQEPLSNIIIIYLSQNKNNIQYWIPIVKTYVYSISCTPHLSHLNLRLNYRTCRGLSSTPEAEKNNGLSRKTKVNSKLSKVFQSLDFEFRNLLQFLATFSFKSNSVICVFYWQIFSRVVNVTYNLLWIYFSVEKSWKPQFYNFCAELWST